MESASEEHSEEAFKLTHSVSNPALHAQEALLLARVGSAPQNGSEVQGDPNFDIRDSGEDDLYKDIGD